ncbi:MAG: 5-oxoprolinase subunit PxpA [Planctomycetota bacterium]
MDSRTIHLGCDLGERDDPAGAALDAALLDYITLANIACGGHAGNESSMRRVVREAAQRGVLIGAHPSYDDRARFGRVSVPLAPPQIAELVRTQVAALADMADEIGAKLTHVKPHGALYHDAIHRPEVASAVADGVAAVDRSLSLVGLAGASALDIWRSRGFAVLGEAFADRRYERDGTLRSRELPDALIDQPGACAAQARDIALGLGASTFDGQRVQICADLLCLHSDAVGAIERAIAVRAALDAVRLTA